MESRGKKKKQISDDELLDQCIKNNEQCFMPSCSKSVKLIKLQCNLCLENFCTSHMLPEVHGCGIAAKKDAAAPHRKPTDPDKKAQLENRLSRKLKEMKNDRKKK